MFDRRRFFGMAVGLMAAKGCFWLAGTEDDADYVIVNGWVLTREDIAGRRLEGDAV
jgi:hypothetical protein